MSKQTTLDGKTLEENFTEWEMKMLIKKADEVAKNNPKYFSELCAYQGAAYHGKPSMFNTLHCCAELEEVFGFSKEYMVNALMNYPIED